MYPEDKKVAELIGRDMEIHLLKGDQVEDFCRDKKMAINLLIVGLCELHSNATMFGGVDSTSFKIKFKRISQRGKKILELCQKSKEQVI